MALTQVDAGLLAGSIPASKLDSNTQYYGFKNRIINGAMSFWQRGTSFSNPTSTNFYTADRWGVNRASDVNGATVSRSTDVPTGFQYSLKLQRTASDSSTAGLFLFNSNETVNTLDLAGHPVTVSFWVKTGANYSGGLLTVTANWGTGTDQRVYSYTGSTSFISTTQAITSTWTRYSFTGTVGASSTEVGFWISWTPTGTAGADDSIYITGVQLEKGSTATTFDYRPYGTELALCQRYYYRATGNASNVFWAGIGYVIDTTRAQGLTFFPVTMRTDPTALEQSGTASDYSVLTGVTATTCTSVPVFNASTNRNLAVTQYTTGATLTASQSIALRLANANSYLAWSTEL